MLRFVLVLLIGTLTWLLQACATVETPIPRPASSGSAQELLAPWLTLTGAWLAPSAPAGTVARAPLSRLQFSYPVGIAARDNDVVVADWGLRKILRYDRSSDTVTPVDQCTGLSGEQGAGLYLATDQSIWVVDPAGRQVLHCDRDGRPLPTLRDKVNLARPVAVVPLQERGEVLVADGLYNRIAVFSPLGRPLRVLNAGRRSFQSISAMTVGPDGLYILDQLAQQVVVLRLTGEFRYAFGDDSLVRPSALAVDRAGRVFVSDDADQSIKVFAHGERIGSVGGFGQGPMRFNQIGGLAVDENLLYVADSLNARVQVLLVTPESMTQQRAN